jgi:hypothetical protein
VHDLDMLQQDYVVRLIRQLALAIARAVGLRGRDEELLRELDAASADALGLPEGALDRLDGKTLAAMLKDPGVIRTFADLLDEEAAAHERLGHEAVGARRRALAAELRGLAP